MTLDDDTRAALGFGDPWTQLALRWPLFIVSRTDTRAHRVKPSTATGGVLTLAQKQEAGRLRSRGKSITEIANRLNVKRSSVRWYFEQKRRAA